VDGRRLLDGVSSLWCAIFGHRVPEIDRALTDQLGQIAHATFLGNASATGVALAKALADLAPGDLNRVFFSDDGSTAVEVAVKMALQFWAQSGHPERNRFVAFGDAYHGDTAGAVSVGGIELFHARFGPLLFDVTRCPSPYARRAEAQGDDARWLELAMGDLGTVLDAGDEDIAAVVLEPGMQGAAGMLTQPPGYVAAVRALTAERGILLILDEVAMGMGRSGNLFASETEGVVPDFLVLAKGLTGGYLPLAATLTSERIFSAFLGAPEEGRTFFHGHTYTGNALGAAAALATLELFARPGFLSGLPARGQALGTRLERLRRHRCVADIRRYGLAAGVELLADPLSGRAFAPRERMGMKVCQAAGRRGVFLRPLGDVVVLMPPLSLSDSELDRLVDALDDALGEVTP
jgi:adenosylmethionine-8-amino-7-oxononanoate aminotransferase